MPNRNSFAARKCSKRALASVAATAIILSGITVVTTLVESRAPALAQDALSSPTMLGQTATRNQLTPTFADVVDRVKPAVVAVRVDVETTISADDRLSSRELDQLPPQLRELLRRFGQSRQPQVGIALGSGFFISSDGYIVTNNHVVEHSRIVQVTTDDGRTLDAKVIGTDPKTDLALLKVTEDGSYPSVPLAKVTPRVGDWVVAIGNPFGLGGTVTAGIISARGRDIGESQYDDFLQVDAPINKGNSGGPTFNLSGEVVGVNTAIYSPSGGSIGLGFAIPSDTVQSVVAQLEKDGKVTRGYLGVQIQPLSKNLAEGLGLATEKGALVGNAQEGSPAAAAGLQAGDVVTAINGEPIADARELSRTVAAFKPGSRVELTYLHGGKQQTANVSLGIQPEEKSSQAERPPEHGPQLGLGLAPAASIPGAGNKGVVVVNVDASGAAAARGIEVGDVILEVAGHAVSSPADVKAGLTRAQNEGKKIVLLRIKNQQGTRFSPLGLGTVG